LKIPVLGQIWEKLFRNTNRAEDRGHSDGLSTIVYNLKYFINILFLVLQGMLDICDNSISSKIDQSEQVGDFLSLLILNISPCTSALFHEKKQHFLYFSIGTVPLL
jgi:hypothetical protein